MQSRLVIVIPQIVMSFLVPQIYQNLLGGNSLNVVILGGISMLIAAASVFIVKDVGAAKLENHDEISVPSGMVAG